MTDYVETIVKCKICGIDTLNDDELCDGCWEVTHRLEDFIKTENGRNYVEKMLAAGRAKRVLVATEAQEQLALTYAEKIQRLADLISKDTEYYLRHDVRLTCENIIVSDTKVTIKPGSKYTKIDRGTSGKYMVDKDGNIFGIKAYGVIHRGHRYGTLDTVDQYYWGGYTAIKKS